jgi:hypothetical protein
VTRRMTSAEALKAGAHASVPCFGLGDVLRRAARTLAQYEAEATARAAMPKMKTDWWLLGKSGSIYYGGSKDNAMWQAEKWNRDESDGDRPYLAVRLAVVEVVEPEPPTPEHVQVPSGRSYRVTGGKLYVCYPGEEKWVEPTIIPVADAALVARLLGEVAHV